MRSFSRTRTIAPPNEYTTQHVGPWHALPWVWPWALCLALLPLAAGLWALWGRDPGAALWGAVAIALGTTGLAALAWRAGRARGAVVRAHAAASVAVAGAWLLAATVFGPFTRPVIDAWVVLLLVGGISWNLRRGLRGHGDEHDSGWAALAERVKLPGSRVMSPVRDGHQVRAVIEAQRGAQTSTDIMAARERIASGLGVPASGVRLVADPDSAARAQLTVVTKDVLRTPMPWPGPSHPGQSIASPLVLGIRETGEPLQLWLPGDHKAGRSATHVLITGMTGAGKSAAGRLLLAEILTRPDALVMLVDTVKARQFTSPFRDRVAELATETEKARALVGKLPGLIAERADQLGERGYDQWEPGCGLPYLIVHVEEAASVIASSRPFALAAQTARSAGVSLIVSLQRAVHTNLPTDVRQQLGAALAFGCRPGDERFSGLSAEVLDGGASPQTWGASRPGYCYAEIPGTDPVLWSAPARTFVSDSAGVAALLGASPDTDQGEKTPQEPSRRAAAGDAKALLLARLRELRDSGTQTVRPADFAAVLAEANRSPAWLSGALRQLVERGVLVDAGRGVYRFAANGAAR
jgi:hypothetical protein